MKSRERKIMVGDSTRFTLYHTTGIGPIVSISSRMSTAYSRRFERKYTSLVPSPTITAVGRTPPATSLR